MTVAIRRAVTRWGSWWWRWLALSPLAGAGAGGAGLLGESEAGARVPAMVVNRLETLQSRATRVNFAPSTPMSSTWS